MSMCIIRRMNVTGAKVSVCDTEIIISMLPIWMDFTQKPMQTIHVDLDAHPPCIQKLPHYPHGKICTCKCLPKNVHRTLATRFCKCSCWIIRAVLFNWPPKGSMKSAHFAHCFRSFVLSLFAALLSSAQFSHILDFNERTEVTVFQMLFTERLHPLKHERLRWITTE